MHCKHKSKQPLLLAQLDQYQFQACCAAASDVFVVGLIASIAQVVLIRSIQKTAKLTSLIQLEIRERLRYIARRSKYCNSFILHCTIQQIVQPTNKVVQRASVMKFRCCGSNNKTSRVGWIGPAVVVVVVNAAEALQS